MDDGQEAKTKRGKKEGSPGHAGFALGFTDPGQPLSEAEFDDVFVRIRSALSEGKDKLFEDKPGVFEDVVRKSGTHILKLHAKEAQDHILAIPHSFGSNQPQRFFPSMNAAYGPYAKIIYQPIAILGHPGAKSLIDHLIEPDELTDRFLAAFVRGFSEESLAAVRTAFCVEKRTVTTLHHETFPIVYVPDGSGGSLQLTPISPMAAFARFRSILLTRDADGVMPAVCGQEVSSKMQNISVAVGGSRIRFLARVPAPLTPTDAGIWRYAKGGAIPAIPGPEIGELIDSFVQFDLARRAMQADSDDAYYNSDMAKGSERLAQWIIAEAVEWIGDLDDAARKVNPEFTPPTVDAAFIVQLLTRSWRACFWRAHPKSGAEDRAIATENVRHALRSPLFQRALKAEAQ